MSTLKLEILGSGCQKCQQLEANVKSAIFITAINNQNVRSLLSL